MESATSVSRRSASPKCRREHAAEASTAVRNTRRSSIDPYLSRASSILLSARVPVPLHQING
jgi:hypothetical protein